MYTLLQTLDGQPAGDAMVLDSVAGHAETLKQLRSFVSSASRSVEIAAPGRCPLCPDWQTLTTFRLVKTEGPILTEQLPGGVLQVSGRGDLLARYVSAFEFPEGASSDHHHPEQMFVNEISPASKAIIVEADDGVDAPETRIYADFNGLFGSPRTANRWAIGLDTFGTLKDLAREGILLREGLRLVVYDASDDGEDLEADGVVFFDSERGRWFAELGEPGYRYVPKRDRDAIKTFPCTYCRGQSAWSGSRRRSSRGSETDSTRSAAHSTRRGR